MLVVAGAVDRGRRACCSRCCSCATPPRHVALEQAPSTHDAGEPPPRAAAARSRDATYRVPALRACSQAGLVNNLNDALAWGLVPLFLAAHGASVGRDRARRRRSTPPSGASAQIGTGHWSDRVGRKPLIVAGMLLQAAALGLLAASRRRVAIAAIAAVAARRRHRARLPDADRRDLRRRLARRARARSSASTASGATWATSSAASSPALVADALGYGGAIAIVAGLTAASGLWVLADMPSATRPSRNVGAATGSDPASVTAGRH